MNRFKLKNPVMISITSIIDLAYHNSFYNLVNPISRHFVAELVQTILDNTVMYKCYWYSDIAYYTISETEVFTLMEKHHVSLIGNQNILMQKVEEIVDVINSMLCSFLPDRTWDVLSCKYDNYENVYIESLGDYRIHEWVQATHNNPNMNRFGYSDEILFKGD